MQAASNYHAEQKAITQGFSATIFNKYATAWRQWRRFCSRIQIAPDLKDIEDLITFLQISAERVRSGLLSAQGQPIKKRLVNLYLRSIGKIFASMGANDSRQNRMEKLNFRLVIQLESYHKEDSPPTIVQPLPVNVIQYLDTAAQGTTARNIAISDLTWVALFFFLWPGEQCKGGTNIARNSFRLKDVQFFIGPQPYNAATASNAVLAQAYFVSLLFTTQKNGVKGQLIGHGCTGHPQEAGKVGLSKHGVGHRSGIVGFLFNEELDVLEPEGMLGGFGTSLVVFAWTEEE